MQVKHYNKVYKCAHFVQLSPTTSGSVHVPDRYAAPDRPAVLVGPSALFLGTDMISDCSCLLQGFEQIGSDEPGLLSSVCCHTLRSGPCSTQAAGGAASRITQSTLSHMLIPPHLDSHTNQSIDIAKLRALDTDAMSAMAKLVCGMDHCYR